jgi:hypothetical protein
MTEATQPRMARGTKLPLAVLAAALFALLAFAPFASAAADPVETGSATVTLNSGFVKSLTKSGVKIVKVKPAKLKGKKATFPVVGGEMDPTNGTGTLKLAGGLQFKHGKKKGPVKALVVDTKKKGLFAKVAGKKVKLATLAGWSYTRAGFGVALTVKKLKLTKAAAKQLNKKLGFKKGKKPFVGNRKMASAKAEEQPATVTVLPGGNVSFKADQELLLKLKDVETNASAIAPTAEKGLGDYELPITGGTIAPSGAAGTVQSAGGLLLTQKLPTSPTTALETEITLGSMWLDLSAKTVTVEVVAKSNASDSLNLGNLGRSSIADLTITGVSADAGARTVSVSSSAVLQPISAEVLEGFVKVYQAYYEAGFYAQFCALAAPKKCNSPDPNEKAAEEAAGKAAAKGAAEKQVEKDHIAAGNPLGTFSFTAQTQ